MVTGGSQRLSPVSHKILRCSAFLIKWSICSLPIILVYGNKHLKCIETSLFFLELPIGIFFHSMILTGNDKTHARIEEKINICQGDGAKQSHSWPVLCRAIGRARFRHPCSLSTTKGISYGIDNCDKVMQTDLITNFLSNHQRRSTKDTSKGHWAVLPRTRWKWCNSTQLYLAFWGKQYNCDISDSFIIGF